MLSIFVVILWTLVSKFMFFLEVQTLEIKEQPGSPLTSTRCLWLIGPFCNVGIALSSSGGLLWSWAGPQEPCSPCVAQPGQCPSLLSLLSDLLLCCTCLFWKMFNDILKDILKITIVSHKVPHLLPFTFLSRSHLVVFQVLFNRK